MSLPRTVAEVIDEHLTLELECIDRMYLNVYVPRLQYERAVVSFFRFHRGHAFASSALMAPISRAFVRSIETFADESGVPVVPLRWQIELFFKELKSTLGFHQYQFQKFAAVEGWTELALATFLYLEWFRVQQLARRGLSEKEKRWWRHQRRHGLCQAIRLASQQAELSYLAERLKTPGGIAKLKRLLRNAFAPEYRAAL